jgi:hypothetical protein
LIIPLTANVTEQRDRRFINLVANLAKLEENQMANLARLLSVINYNSYAIAALTNTQFKDE